MLDRIRDWRPTLVGALIAAVIVAALFARPAWGAAEMATLAGAVATALLGAWARSGPPPPPAAAPPGPGPGVIALAIAGLLGASGALHGVACAAQDRAAAATALDLVDDAGCVLVVVMARDELAGEVCQDVAEVLEQLLRMRVAALGASGTCDAVAVVVDGRPLGRVCRRYLPAFERALAMRADGGVQ